MSYTLVPFRPCPFVEHFAADFALTDHIECEWRIDGNMDSIRWPVVTGDRNRITGLWETTCFEWFYGACGDDGYVEFNLAPSHDWNAFAFDGPRAGMREADDVEPLAVSFHYTTREALLHARVKASVALPGHLGLSAVLEDVDGGRHHFALAHNTGHPDFHCGKNHVHLAEPTP